MQDEDDARGEASASIRTGWRARDPHDVLRLVIGAALLLASAQPLDQQRVDSLEREVFHLFNSLPQAIYPALWIVMQFGHILAVPATAAIAALKRNYRLALQLAVAGTSAYLLARVIKQLVERGRPDELIADFVLRGAPAAGFGYISGHSAVAAALATTASPYLTRRGRVVAWTLAGLVMIGRMYVGAHLPLDVLGGAGLGVLLGALVHVVFGAPPTEDRELVFMHRLRWRSPSRRD